MTPTSTQAWDAAHLREVLTRRRWWLLTPLFILGLGGVLLPHWLPAQYRSEALILVRPQEVPAQYVQPSVTATAADRLQALTQQILSRPHLRQLINSLGLYAQERPRVSMDALVDRMARDITTTAVTAPDQPNQLTGFHIAYTAASPALAQRVVSDLTSLFLKDDLQNRVQQSASATSFLGDELRAAQQTLVQKQAALSAFKAQHLGELPEQEQGNIEILQSLNLEYNTALDELENAKQQKAYYQSLAADASAPPEGTELDALRVKLAELQATHTENYPDVKTTEDEIARLEATPAATSPTAPQSNLAADATSRLKALDMEIDAKQKEAAAAEQHIRTLQGELSSTPLLEEQLNTLQQGVDDAQKNYQSLLERTQASQVATDLETNQQGSRFQVIDPASLPVKPVSPNRDLFLAAGWLLGLALGAGLTMMRELADRTVHNEAALASLTPVPVLATIPQISILRWRQPWFRAVLETAVVCALVAVCTAAALWVRS